MTKTLAQYQDRMIEIADRAKPLLDSRERTDLHKLASYRLSMAQTLTSYQLHFHREIFARRMADAQTDQTTRDVLKGVKTECIVLAEDFRAHTKRWTVESMAREWPVYASNSIALGLRIRKHVAEVRALMRSMAAPA